MAETPSRGSKITKEWLEMMMTTAFKKPISIKSFHNDAGSEKGDNFMSTLAAVQVTTNDEEKFHFMIKMAPEGEFIQDMFQEAQMFEKEANIYKVLIRDLEDMQIRHFGKVIVDIPFPKCYYVHKEDDGRAVIVMEDLRASGYQMHDKNLRYDRSHARLVLEGIARFHALTFAMKYLDNVNIEEKYPWAKDRTACVDRDEFKSILNDGMTALSSILQSLPGQEENIERISQFCKAKSPFERYSKYVVPKEPIAVITHGDFWNNNMMYKYEEGSSEPCGYKLIDLQIIKYAHPAADLVYFLYSSTDGELRSQHLTRILEFYYDSFMNVLETLQVPFGRKDYPLEKFHEDFNDHVELGFIMASMIMPVVLSQGDAIPSFAGKDKEEIQKAMKEFHKKLVEQATDSQRSKVVSLVQEMRERNII